MALYAAVRWIAVCTYVQQCKRVVLSAVVHELSRCLTIDLSLLGEPEPYYHSIMFPVMALLACRALKFDTEILLYRTQRVPLLSGIGKRTAYNLARMGAKVIMACRSLERGEKARQELEEEMRLVVVCVVHPTPVS